MLGMIYVGDFVFLLYSTSADNTKFRIVGIDQSDGAIAHIDVEGEAYAYFVLSMLVNSEEYHEADVELEQGDDIFVKAYTTLQNSDMKRFLP